MSKMEQLIEDFGALLTSRQLAILSQMAENRDTDDGEIVYSMGHGFIGYDQISRGTIDALLRACAISLDQFSDKACERYVINETGLSLVAKRRAGVGVR